MSITPYTRHLLLQAALALLACSAFGNTTDTLKNSGNLLTEAYQLTVKGDLDGAKAVYQNLVKVAPEDGYPAMTRFLSRTGQTTAVQELLNSPDFNQQDPMVKARSYTSAHMRQEAIASLRADAAETTGSTYQRALLLSNQLEILGEKDAAAKEIEAALTAPELADNDRRDLFMRLLQLGGPDHLAAVLPVMIDAAVSSSSISYPHARAMALDGLTALSMGPGYADFHAKLEASAKNSASRAWLYALSCIKKGDDASAQEALDSLSTPTLTRREKAICLEELARMVAQDSPRATALYEELLTVSDNPDRIRLNLAQQYFLSENYNKAIAMLKQVNFDGLEGADYQTAINLYLTSLGAQGSMSELVAEFTRLTSNLPYGKVRDVAPAAFLRFAAGNEEDLRAEVEKVIAEDSGNSNLYLLLMSLENQIGNYTGIIRALQRYVEANPTNVHAAEELADSLAAEAWQIVADNPETSPPLSELERVGNAASKALWNVIQLRPYAPEPYRKLISLYNLYNQPEKAREVPRYLADRPNATADEIHLAAYIYATEGYPELSLPLYERALSMQNDTRFRLNYAAALGRTGRVDDAMKIYRDLIKNGVNGKQYHVHEVHLSALRLAQHYGQEQQHVDFLMSLLNDPSVAERRVFLLEEGKVLASGHRYNEALQFFMKYREEFPEDRVTATDIIVSTYAEMGKFDIARRILTEEISNTTDTQNLAFLRNNYALTYRMEGNVERAVVEWQKLAEDLPQEHSATRALLNAARALSQSGRVNQARQFYEKFVALNTGDVTGEQIAREELDRLDRLEVPASMLVESAILEYGPGNDIQEHNHETDTGVRAP